MREINLLVIHCSDTLGDVSANTIRQWHLERGFRDIGYHHVIRTSGSIERGRPIEEQGAHVKGHNKHSIGVCLAGRGVYTQYQWAALELIVNAYQHMFPGIEVKGHNEFSSKTCPNFDVQEWLCRSS